MIALLQVGGAQEGVGAHRARLALDQRFEVVDGRTDDAGLNVELGQQLDGLGEAGGVVDRFAKLTPGLVKIAGLEVGHRQMVVRGCQAGLLPEKTLKLGDRLDGLSLREVDAAAEDPALGVSGTLVQHPTERRETVIDPLFGEGDAGQLAPRRKVVRRLSCELLQDSPGLLAPSPREIGVGQPDPGRRARLRQVRGNFVFLLRLGEVASGGVEVAERGVSIHRSRLPRHGLEQRALGRTDVCGAQIEAGQGQVELGHVFQP